ncbi:unnamed protein product [Rhizoctonia solani]|uniref:Uncharacterized protein n=1 Tax=Rhizoctonia solani TaxID=456999 RepID=A0A8H3E7E4_9AGAM|nr:unnamed protein product [Rhizoctonia solani]
MLGLLTQSNSEIHSCAPGDITPKLTALTTQFEIYGASIQTDPSMKSQMAIQAASIVSHVASQGMNVGPDALGGDVQAALKGFLESIGRCVPGVDNYIGRMLSVNDQVFLKNNVGGAMAVLSQADEKQFVGVDVSLGELAVELNVGGRASVELRLNSLVRVHNVPAAPVRRDLDVLGLISTLEAGLENGQISDVATTSKSLASLTTTAASAEEKAQIAIKMVSIITHSLDKNLDGNQLKDLILNLEKSVPGVGKDIYRIMNVGTIVKLRAGSSSGAATVLNQAELEVAVSI